MEKLAVEVQMAQPHMWQHWLCYMGVKLHFDGCYCSVPSWCLQATAGSKLPCGSKVNLPGWPPLLLDATHGFCHLRYAAREPPAASVRIGSRYSAISFTPTPALGGASRTSLPLRFRSCCLSPSQPGSLQQKHTSVCRNTSTCSCMQ